METRPVDPMMEEDEKRGFKFYASIALGGLAVALAIFFPIYIFFKAWAAWGILGAFIAFAILMVVYAWLRDRLLG
jgi:hypothetical protein